MFVVPHPADGTLGETRDSQAASRLGGVAIDADLQGERDMIGAACRGRGRGRHPGTSPVVEADSVFDPQREQELHPAGGHSEMRKISERV
ncbi:hypothetical protein [Candidatus Poriferisodalis sp.]|uniref:hypothetical protein n=1 Tax=Candidatus Poriferisodalis sp. TaxID=3101277 RepID=UPI003B027E98